MNYRALTIINGILIAVLALAYAFSTQRTLGDIQRTGILLFVASGGAVLSIVGALFGKQGFSRKKKILGIIGIPIVLFLSYNIIYDIVNPITSITDVEAYYGRGPPEPEEERYRFQFTLRDRYGHSTPSDGTVNIKITLDNDVLYEKTFTVYESQFQIGGGGWILLFGGSGGEMVYKWSITASDVPESPSVLEDYAEAGRNVTSIITFTTPQGKMFTATDDVYHFPT